MRRRSIGPIVTSIKNVQNLNSGITSTQIQFLIAKAVTSPSPTVKSDVSFGCLIKAIHLSFDVCGLGGTGVLNVADMFVMKNPGNNLTPPVPGSEGGSNEKKFVFKTWRAMIMRNQDGNVPYHWEGWIKIPRRYHRMGTDDTLTMEVKCTSGVTGHFQAQAIYKWYR